VAKKKKRKRRAGGAGTDVQERRQQRLDQRRQEKAARIEQQRRAARRAQMIRIALYALVGVGVFWFFFLRAPSRPESIRGHQLRLFDESQGVQRHVDEGETVDYETTPPAYGFHSPGSLQCGIWGEQQPSEPFVHSLEHGAVGLLYDPQSAEPQAIERLEAIAGRSDSHIISMPFAGMEHPITIVSWGEMMELDELDEPALREYVETFRDKGPESGQSCPMQVDSPFVPEPAPSPSPSPSPSPTRTRD
jgi:hypothetical protein